MSFLGNAIEFYVMHNSTHYPKTVTQFDLKINVYIKLNKSLSLSIYSWWHPGIILYPKMMVRNERTGI